MPHATPNPPIDQAVKPRRYSLLDKILFLFTGPV